MFQHRHALGIPFKELTALPKRLARFALQGKGLGNVVGKCKSILKGGKERGELDGGTVIQGRQTPLG